MTHHHRLRVVAAGVLVLSLVSGAGTLATAARVAACPAGPGPCAERTARLVESFETWVTGGRFGFLVASVNGPVLASLRADETFYPASSIKVLYLLEAIRWVAAQADPAAALRTALPVRAEGCGGGPSTPEPLDAVLRAMMRQSDNLRANAVGDFFGLDAINRTAVELGGVSPQSVVVHRFACGGPANDPANRMTAADLAEVYRRYGLGTLLGGAADALFASYLLGAETGVLDIVAAEESAALGRPDLAARFLSEVSLIYKTGWWGTNLSIGGYSGMPRRGCGTIYERGLAFAAFVSEADAVAAGFDMSRTVGELLREEIRASLITLSLPAHACRAAWAPYAS